MINFISRAQICGVLGVITTHDFQNISELLSRRRSKNFYIKIHFTFFSNGTAVKNRTVSWFICLLSRTFIALREHQRPRFIIYFVYPLCRLFLPPMIFAYVIGMYFPHVFGFLLNSAISKLQSSKNLSYSHGKSVYTVLYNLMF